MNSHLSKTEYRIMEYFWEYRGEVYFWGIDEVF